MTKTFANQDRLTFFTLQQTTRLSTVEILTRLSSMSEIDRSAMNQANYDYHISIGCVIEYCASGQIVVTFP